MKNSCVFDVYECTRVHCLPTRGSARSDQLSTITTAIHWAATQIRSDQTEISLKSRSTAQTTPSHTRTLLRVSTSVLHLNHHGQVVRLSLAARHPSLGRLQSTAEQHVIDPRRRLRLETTTHGQGHGQRQWTRSLLQPEWACSTHDSSVGDFYFAKYRW